MTRHNLTSNVIFFTYPKQRDPIGLAFQKNNGIISSSNRRITAMKNLEVSCIKDCERMASSFFDEIGSRHCEAEFASSCSQASTDSDFVSTPRTFCRSYLRTLLGSDIGKKIIELRTLLVDGADSRPIEVLDELCRLNFAGMIQLWCKIRCKIL